MQLKNLTNDCTAFTEPRLICPVCRINKEIDIEIPGLFAGRRKMTVMCGCEQEEYAAKVRRRYSSQVTRTMSTNNENEPKPQTLKGLPITTRPVLSIARQNKSVSGNNVSVKNISQEILNICDQYIQDCANMVKNNTGMLIANLDEKAVHSLSAHIASMLHEKEQSISTISVRQLTSKDLPDIKKSLKKDFLLIEGLCLDKSNAEILFSIIEARCKTGKPIIVLAELSAEALDKPSSVTLARIYDKIIQLCTKTIEQKRLD